VVKPCTLEASYGRWLACQLVLFALWGPNTFVYKQLAIMAMMASYGNAPVHLSAKPAQLSWKCTSLSDTLTKTLGEPLPR